MFIALHTDGSFSEPMTAHQLDAYYDAHAFDDFEEVEVITGSIGSSEYSDSYAFAVDGDRVFNLTKNLLT